MVRAMYLGRCKQRSRMLRVRAHGNPRLPQIRSASFCCVSGEFFPRRRNRIQIVFSILDRRLHGSHADSLRQHACDVSLKAQLHLICCTFSRFKSVTGRGASIDAQTHSSSARVLVINNLSLSTGVCMLFTKFLKSAMSKEHLLT